MEKRKRSRQPTGRPRGRPKKHTPAAAPGDVDTLIAGATAAPVSPAEAAASLDDLARDLERERASEQAKAPSAEDPPPLTGDVHNPDGSRAGDDPAETPWGQQKSREIAVYIVFLFAALAVVMGDEWAVTEEEARTVSDATVRAYPDVIVTIEREYKFAGPLAALLLLLFTKWVAWRHAKHAPADVAERLPGTAPADA